MFLFYRLQTCLANVLTLANIDSKHFPALFFVNIFVLSKTRIRFVRIAPNDHHN
jgi:hypothetical protein